MCMICSEIILSLSSSGLSTKIKTKSGQQIKPVNQQRNTEETDPYIWRYIDENIDGYMVNRIVLIDGHGGFSYQIETAAQ